MYMYLIDIFNLLLILETIAVTLASHLNIKLYKIYNYELKIRRCSPKL